VSDISQLLLAQIVGVKSRSHMAGMAKARREILISEIYSRLSPWREDV
jgi:hypothetical protein